MTIKSWALEMALYGKWQNDGLFGLCDDLPDEERKRDRGMFFGSIHNTLDHIYLVETRLLDYLETGAPDGAFAPAKRMCPDFQALQAAREGLDDRLLRLPDEKPDGWLAEAVPLKTEGFGKGRSFPRQYLLMQLFNHGTHHRSQVTAEMHRMGLDYGCTDIPFNPDSQF